MRYWPLAVMFCAVGAQAQDSPSGQRALPMAVLQQAVADPASFDVTLLPMPELRFEASPEVEANFDKYFYFHRADNDFATAVGDVMECDALASGTNYSMSVTYAGGSILAAGVGSAVGSIVADAIMGSAQRRAQRRINLRRCMQMKGYARYGLPEAQWRAFNFQEGLTAEEPAPRLRALLVQARIASMAEAPAERALHP